MKVQKLYYTACNCPMKISFGGLNINGMRLNIPIVSGDVVGDVINGKIVKLGADYNTIRYNGSSNVIAKYQIVTDDGATIDLHTYGMMKFTKESLKYGISKKSLELGDYMYFREHLYFKTADERYAWLNDTPCFAIIAMKVRVPNFVICYDAYAILPDEEV